jgi:hypothetical protein
MSFMIVLQNCRLSDDGLPQLLLEPPFDFGLPSFLAQRLNPCFGPVLTICGQIQLHCVRGGSTGPYPTVYCTWQGRLAKRTFSRLGDWEAAAVATLRTTTRLPFELPRRYLCRASQRSAVDLGRECPQCPEIDSKLPRERLHCEELPLYLIEAS